MSQKVIQFPMKGNMAIKTAGKAEKEIALDEDTYMEHLRRVSGDLRQIADMFEVPVQEVIINLLYTAIGDEVVTTLMEGDIGDEE